MFHFLHLTSLFRSPKRNFAHQRLFLPAWPSRPSTPDEAKAIVTVWNPKRDQLSCPNITGQLAVPLDGETNKGHSNKSRPPWDRPRKQAALYWWNCLFTRRAELREWRSFPLADLLGGWLGLPCGGHLRGRPTFLYATRLLVALWLTFGPRSQAFHSIFVISTAGHCSFRAALGWHCGNQILGQHTGVEGIGCIFEPEGKDERFAITWKVGEKVWGFKGSYLSQWRKKKHFRLPSKLKRYQ